MSKYYINLHGLPNADELYNQIRYYSFDMYPFIQKPDCYEVIWEAKKPISELVPKLPPDRILESF